MNPISAQRGSAHLWRWLGLCLIVLKLWLVAAQPIFAIGGAGHDDRLYLELAEHILHGEWLGQYSQLTLMKGPMYSLWIAFTFLLGVPLPLSQHLLYLAGCGLIVRSLRPYLRSEGAAFAVFAVLWLNPITYDMPVLGRILRQNIYTPLTLFFFAGLIALETRRSSSALMRLAWGALLGLSGAALYLTREETIWAVPSAILLIATAGWNSWRLGEKLRPLIIPVVATIACFSLGVGTICALNRSHYKWFGTVEFRSPKFLAAYGALQRVIPTEEIPYVPVTREAREKIYAVSPSFAELRPYLEGDIGTGWAAGPSIHLTGKPKEAREIAGGWFMWALRDTVIASGHNKSAGDALSFYGHVAKEVNAACDDGRLKAWPRRDSMVPRWKHEYATKLIEKTPGYLHFFIFFQGFSAVPPNSMGNAQLLQLFNDLTRWHPSPAPEAPQFDVPNQQRFDAGRILFLDRMGKVSCTIASILVITGLFGWAGLFVWSLFRKHLSYLFVLATATLGGSAAVVVINLLVDVMSFPNISTGALAEAYPLILLFGVLIVIEAVAAVRGTKAKHAAAGSS